MPMLGHMQKLRIFSVLAVCAGISACSALPGDDSRYESAETVLHSDGQYRQAARDGALSPLEQHRLAKANVDPVHVNKKNAYVKTVKQVEAEQAQKQQKTRVAAIERDVSIVKNEFKGLRDSVNRAAIAPASGTPGVSVKGVRTGAHPGKTRLVLDLDGPAEFQYSVDNAQNLLVINLSAQNWDAPVEQVFSNNKVLKAYAAKRGQGGGTVVALKLQGPSRVITGQKLGKNAAGNYRIFLDVAPL